MEEQKSLVERVTGWPRAAVDYVKELQAEMRRVTWPSWKQVRATTGVVIASVFAFAAYFAVVDFFLGSSINKIFEAFTQ